MKLYGGIDLHSNNSVIHLVDENGVSHFRKRVNNDLTNIIALLLVYRDNLVGLVVESTYNWYWLVYQWRSVQQWQKERPYEQ